MGQHPNYLYRMTTCFAVSTLAPALSLDVIEQSIIPMMDKLVNDDIPNIRFNVAKSYGQLINTLKQLPEQGTVIALEKAGTPGQGCQKATDVITKSILPNLEKLQQELSYLTEVRRKEVADRIRQARELSGLVVGLTGNKPQRLPS